MPWRWIAVAAALAALALAEAVVIGTLAVKPPVPPVLRPAGLAAGTATVSSVSIGWSPPVTGPLPGGYLIIRGGRVIASVAGSVTSYQARGLAPATAYTYQVAAIRGSVRSARSSPLVVRTLTPPAAAAVLTGSWAVHYRHTRSYGFRDAQHLGTDTWTFTPVCAAGPCSVRLTGEFQGSPITSALRRSGAVYRGKAAVRGYVSCGSASAPSDMTIRIEVRAGSAAGVRWVARSWAGAVVFYSPPGFGCDSAGISARIAGTPSA